MSKTLVFRLGMTILLLAISVEVTFAAPPAADTGPSVEVTMQFIQDMSGAQISATLHAHDNAKNQDDEVTERQSAPTSKTLWPPCMIDELSLRDVDKITITQWSKEVLAANPTWTLKDVHPEIYVVRVSTKWRPEEMYLGFTEDIQTLPNGTQSKPVKHVIMGHVRTNQFEFDDAEIAARVAKALQHAVDLCGGGSQSELFSLNANEKAKADTLRTDAVLQSNALAGQQGRASQIADLQSRISSLKDDLDTDEQAAAGFDQEAQVLGGAAATMASGLATQQRAEVRRITGQINDLQSQLQSIQDRPSAVSTQPLAASSPLATSTSTSAAATPLYAATGDATGSRSPNSVGVSVSPTAFSCWSSELDAINDPVARARMGNNVVQKTIQIVQSGGTAALDQEIRAMQQEQQQAQRDLQAANADIAAIGAGLPPEVNPRICATMRQSGEPSAIMAAMCQRLTAQNALHLANGLMQVMQCVRGSTH